MTTVSTTVSEAAAWYYHSRYTSVYGKSDIYILTGAVSSFLDDVHLPSLVYRDVMLTLFELFNHYKS